MCRYLYDIPDTSVLISKGSKFLTSWLSGPEKDQRKAKADTRVSKASGMKLSVGFRVYRG